MRPNRSRHSTALLLFLAPLLVLLIVFLAYPVILSVLTSFRAGNSDTFIGFDNYIRFFNDPASWQLVQNSFIRGIGGVVPSYLLGLVAALALHRAFRGRSALRLLILVPFVISAPVALGMWKLLLDPLFGIPAALGFDISNVFSNENVVWWVLLGINAWASFQFYTMLLLAGISGIPDERYEAARMDGADVWQRFTQITLPGISAVAVAACGLHFINSFNEFNLIYILTGGGPLGKTQTLATASYMQAFSNYDNGYATTLTTLSVATMALAIAVLLLLVMALRRVWRVVKPHLPEWRLPRLRFGAGRGSLRRQGKRAPVVTASIMALVSMAPILFVISRSLDGSPGSADAVSILPRQWTLSNFPTVLGSDAFWDTNSIAVPPLAYNFFNSIIVTFCVTAIVVSVSMFGGYAISRLTGWLPKALMGLLVMFQLVPIIVLVFPLYEVLSSMRLLGTLVGQTLATSVLFISMGTLFFKVFFDNIPREVEESAALDGAGTVRTLLQIVRPLAKPVMGAMTAYTLINTWNEYLLATTLVSDSATRTFPAALQQYMSSYNFVASTTPGQQAVYLLIPIIAAIVLLSLTQRQLAAAYEGGAVKG